MLSIWLMRGQEDGILGGPAQSRRCFCALALRHQLLHPWPIQNEAGKQFTLNQRQQRRPRLTRRPWLLSNLPPQEEVGQLQGLAVWFASSGSQSDAVALRLEQGDPRYGSLFAVKPEPLSFAALFNRLEDVCAGEAPEGCAAEFRSSGPEAGAIPVELRPVGP